MTREDALEVIRLAGGGVAPPENSALVMMGSGLQFMTVLPVISIIDDSSHATPKVRIRLGRSIYELALTHIEDV